jgi:hypothetical protein
MKTYSTIQVAKIVGVASGTFHRWIREGLVPAPPLRIVVGMKVRLWTSDDIAKVRQYKKQHYWGRGGKKPRNKEEKVR